MPYNACYNVQGCQGLLEIDDTVIQQLKDANPHKEYKVEQVAVYDSDAFRYGRDPDLH